MQMNDYMFATATINYWPKFKPKEHYIFALDKALWPINPIRDYIMAQIEKIEEKYEAIFKALDSARV